MKCFLKRIIEGESDEDSHRYFVRFGKGDYKRRFLISFNKGNKIKVKASFELANDIIKFVRENKELNFSGKILTKDRINGKEGKKKSSLYVYEVSECNLKEFENAYYYLLDANDSEIVLKIKKSLPKPGKDEEKIDDSFCSLEITEKYWQALKEVFFWDVPDCKKAVIEHEIIINDIEIPLDEKDPVKIRERAKRKGRIIRKISADGKEINKEYALCV